MEILEINENSNNTIVGWFDLPFEMRSKIIEMMDTPTKCKFSRFSKQCYKEVGMSKNYIKAVLVNHPSHFPPRIIVLFNDLRSELLFNGKTVKVELFHLTMIKIPCRVQGYSPIIRPMIRPLKKWEIEVEEGEDAQSTMTRYFGYILKNASYSLMTLSISYRNFPYEKTNIRHMKKLWKIETLRVQSEINLIKCGFLDVKQLNSIPEKINICGVCLDFEQVLQLRANRIVLDPIGLTSEEINRYLKLWMNGQVHKNLKHLQLQMNGAELDNEQVVDGLELYCISVTYGLYGRVRFKLRSLANPDRRVKVRYNKDFLIMTFDDYVPELTPEEKKIKYPKPPRDDFMIDPEDDALSEEEWRYESHDEEYGGDESHEDAAISGIFY